MYDTVEYCEKVDKVYWMFSLLKASVQRAHAKSKKDYQVIVPKHWQDGL